MFGLLFPLLLGQCGPGGCSIPTGWPQWQPRVVDRTDWQVAVFDVEVVPPDGQVWFDETPVPLSAGKGRIQTPPLEPGWRYRYRVTARWGDIERHWTVSFSPGQTVRVMLRRDEATPSTSGSNPAPNGRSVASPSPPASTKPDQPPPPSPRPSPFQSSSSASNSNAPSGAAHPAGPGPTAKLEGHLPVVEQDGVQNFGIDRSRLQEAGERVTLDGREITRAEATRILEAGSLADDSGKVRLTVIGTEADRRRVLDDLKGPLADIAGQCLVQDYPPDHWAVTAVGFYTAGKPTIYVQAPDGTVLHRQDDYADGAEGFRQAFERLRKPDPNYQPDKDRDLRRDGPLARLWDLLTHPFRTVLSWVLAAGLVFVLIVAVTKGWLVYLLGLLASLVPGPPKTAGTAPRQAAEKRPARQSAAKSRARR